MLIARRPTILLAAVLFLGHVAPAGAQATPPVISAATSSITVDEATFVDGAIAYRLRAIEARDTSMSRDDLVSVFAGTGPTLVERLSRVAASELRAAEVIVEDLNGVARESTTYRDVVVSRIGGARIGLVAASAGSFERGAGEKGGVGTFGRLTIADLDLDAARALGQPGTGAADEPLRRILASFSLADLAFRDRRGGSVKVARLVGEQLSGRGVEPSVRDAMERLRVGGERATAPDEADAVSVLAGLTGAVRLKRVEATGLDFDEPADANGARGRIERILFTDDVGEVQIDGLALTSPTANVRAATLAFGGLSLRSVPGAGGSKKLIPTLARADIRDLAIEIGSMAGTVGPTALAFTIEAIDARGDKPIDGIPTEASFEMRRLAFSIPKDTSDETLKGIMALGYERVDASLRMVAGWNNETRELAIREFSLSGDGMGRIGLGAQLGDLSRDAFDPDPAIAMAAFAGATARSLEIALEDGGLFGRLVGREAERQKRTPEDLRREYGVAAAIGVPAMLGSTPAARAVGQAVARFVARPGRLTITATTKDAAGLGIADFVAAADPMSLLGRLDVTASAQ